MAIRWAVTGGTWSSTSTWNDGATLGIPTVGDDVFTNGFTVTMDVNATVNSLNNSARARTIATPAMTANNAPSPYVAAASSVSGGNQPYFAFDRNTGTATFWSTATATGWISIDFGSSTIIDAYTIFGRNAQTVNPRNWTFEGSSNNSTWTVLQTVTLPSAIGASSSYSSGSIGNITAYRYYRVNISLNGGSASDLGIAEIELYQPFTAALAAGGSFNFNTAGVTVSATSTSASLSAGATNLITVTATGGTVTINLASSVTGLNIASTQIFNHNGNCNFNLSGNNFNGGGVNAAYCINKSSNGTITITGNLSGGVTGAGVVGLFSTNGNTIVYGNVSSNIFNSGGNAYGIQQSSGNVTVYGNVSGGGAAGSNVGIFLTGAISTLTIIGNVSGGNSNGSAGVSHAGASSVINVTGNIYGGVSTNTRGIIASSLIINVIGNIYGGIGNPGLDNNGTVNITGDVFGSSSHNAIVGSSTIVNLTGNAYSGLASAINLTTGTVNLTGNMYNTLGRMAIWCPNVFISNTATTLWRMDIGGGATRTLYSVDSFPNLPSVGNVRSGIGFGPASGLTGTMIVPTPSNVRVGVLTDNTVGTANITAQDILNFINTSSDPLAVRMRTMLTDNSAGQLISEYNFV